MLSLLMLFLRTNWRVISIVLIVSACWYKLNALINERDEYKTNYLTLVASYKSASDMQNKIIADLKKSAQARVDKLTNEHQDILNNVLKGKANEKRTIDALNIERDSLRNRLANQASIRLPENDTHSITSNDSNTTSDRAYIETLEHAGAVCAADYNYCKAYVDSQQQKIGVE